MKIKLNNVKDLHQARFASALGIEFIAFAPDLSIETIQEIAKWLQGPQIVVVNPPLEIELSESWWYQIPKQHYELYRQHLPQERCIVETQQPESLPCLQEIKVCEANLSQLLAFKEMENCFFEITQVLEHPSCLLFKCVSFSIDGTTETFYERLEEVLHRLT